MLSKSFKSGKCKTSLKLAVSRIKLLKNKRDIQVRHLRRELAQLLATGQEQTARIRVENVIREEKTMSGYDLIEIYCELIVARLPIIESQKSCPIDLKEAICSVIFASPRCADLPELVDVRKHFAAKYGKDFITSALELRPDCGVNRMIVEKLSAKAPDTETKIKILTAIAKEHDVKWDPKAVEEELQNPKDLLNGSSSFMRANEIRMEPLNVNFSPVASQKEADSKIHQNEIPTKPTSNSTSPANLRTSTFTVLPTRNESMTSDRKSGVSEVRDSYSHTETVSSIQPTWMTEFKDAISAVQVAAESAERASIAARAAAELATRGNISRQNSNDPNGSSIYSSGNTLPNIVPSSKLKDVRNESIKMDDNLVNDFQGVKDEVDKLPREELRGGISHFNADDMKVYSQINNGEKFDGILGSFSRIKSVGSKKEHGEADFIEEDVEVNYDGTFFPSSIAPPDDDTIWVPSIGMQQTSNTHEINDHKPHTSSDYASAVFDDYGPEPNDFKNDFLDSFDNKKNDQKVFSMSPTNIFSDSLHESHAAALEKVSSAKFHDNNTVTYDDSDGAAEDEDDLSSSLKNGTVQNSRLLHEERGSRQESGPQVELQPSSSSKARPLMGSEENDHLQVPSSGSELDTGSELGLKFGRLTGGLKNRGYNYPPPYTASSVVHSSLPSKEIADSTISGAEQPISRQEKTFTSLVIPDEDRYDQESSWNASTSADSGKAEGSQLEEYTEVSRSNKTLARDKPVEDTSRFGVNEFFSNQEYSEQYRGGNLTATNVSEAFIEKIDDEKPRTKAYKELSSRTSRTDFDSDGDGEKRNSDISIESRGNSSSNSQIKLSRRTRDLTTKGRSNPKSIEYSDVPNSESEGLPLSRAVDQAKILQGNPNLKPPKQNSPAEQRVHEDSAHKVNTKNTTGRPNPVTSLANSGNNNTLDSGGGSKLQGTESPKAPHVHPKLPDYDTLAAHFQSLRSNRR